MSSPGKISSTPIVAMAPGEMQEAYLEYRRACYNVTTDILERGLIAKLERPKMADEIISEMGFLPARIKTLELFLKALAGSAL